ncbi:MAG TPA: hypothetical protein VHG70_13755 [Nocardioidaceae bacterium]|nr:hypothetical protein [Nocardioidaceae bacterium]
MNPSDTRGSAPLTGLVAVAVLIAVVVGGVLLTQFGTDSTAPPDDNGQGSPATPASRPAAGGGAPSEAQRVLAGTRALLALERAVRAEREDLFRRVFAVGASADAGADLFTSLRRLPLSTYSMRYIGEVSHRGSTWRADVAVQWGLRRVDRRAITSEVEVTFTGNGPSARVVAIAPADDEHAPVWLLGRLEVERVGPALVLSLQPPLTDGVVAQTRRAVSDVQGVLDGWNGELVVVLPETTEQLEQLLAAEEGTYDSIAAVTASADGSGDPTAPVRVVLNPPVFTTLGPIAGQVVLSHETTHAATGATFRDMPLWLVEGFGDYVALAGEPVPVDVAAGQALKRVRRSGPPDALPAQEDFATSSHGLGASYEAAWLACRLIAEQYGEDRLLRFYQEVSRSGDVERAFASVLDSSEEQFTAQWRDYLRELAG